MKKIDWLSLYTDGSCLKNPGGASGWSAIIVWRGKMKEAYGGIAVGTNNRAEMWALYEGLKAIKAPSHIKLYTDSKLLTETLGGRYAAKSNTDIWNLIFDEVVRHKEILPIWVKGHSGNPYNERCDILARRGAERSLKTQKDFKESGLPVRDAFVLDLDT